MPQTFKVDQTATFQGVAFLSCSPKTAFGSTEQEKTKDGLPKWEVQVIGGFRDSFGKTSNEIMKIGVNAYTDPADGFTQFTPIQLVNFEVGVMERTKKGADGVERITGVQVWYRAESIRSLLSGATNGALSSSASSFSKSG
jgi:hypothetical protein